MSGLALDLFLVILGAVIGTLGAELVSFIKRKHRKSTELRDNLHIDLSGDWYAAWQVRLEGKEVVNIEKVRIDQKGSVINMKNLEKAEESDGGYFWESNLEFVRGLEIMGVYFASKKESSSSRGCLFYIYFSQKKLMLGRWVGTAHDGDVQTGISIIAKRREEVKEISEKLCKRRDSKVGIINLDYLWSKSSRS